MPTPLEVDDNDLLKRYPGVALDHVNKHFYRGLLDRQVRLNRCMDCGHWHHRPKPVCPKCWSQNLQPTAVEGTGTVYLVIFLHQGPPAEGVDYASPHPVATVELDEQVGLRFTSAVAGAGEGEIAIGDRVELDWIERSGRPFPVWRPITGEGSKQ